jgi:hypothetical protein
MPNRRRFLAVILPLAALLQAAPAQAQSPPKLFIYGDMLRGALKGMTEPGCVLSNRFKHKDQVVWRIRVLDARTGQALDDKGLRSVVVELPDGQKFPARFGRHPPPKPVDTYWTASWIIPESYPTGSLSYKVTATALDGEQVSWAPFKPASSQLTVIAGNATFTTTSH